MGDRLLSSVDGGRSLALIECASGRELGRASLDARLAAPPLLSGDRAWLLGADGRLRVLSVPAMRELASRADMPLRARIAVSGAEAGLVAVGGEGRDALRILDAATLADVHRYRLDAPIVVAALADVPGRSSFLVGLAEPAAPAEVWELAYSPDAPPVLKGLVHDYRMNEAIPLPGRFTPRAAPVVSPTARLLPGPVPYEWLRVDTAGVASVLHLEVRREIARLREEGEWLAAAWRGEQARGWLLGLREGAEIRRLESGSWRRGPPRSLPGRLLAMLPFGDMRGAVLALAVEGGVALAEIDSDSLAVRRGETIEGANAALATLAASADGRCIAMLDRDGRWLAAVKRRK
ncbi:PQQ-binding-like beta-propeller repeat protein [Zeimonas arvi]|uniref:Uncharacterized protein n=1 Tax=Zeimonas arvi TaxID=2498847 RepID=A0A5C8NVW9_9BURK|nr:hypothetical protein [Zeimonas arvi]TXL65326.1 hypothetical protein FHP08_11080 [Zeimonas arvi]